jgi:hypothetical protein
MSIHVCRKPERNSSHGTVKYNRASKLQSIYGVIEGIPGQDEEVHFMHPTKNSPASEKEQMQCMQ